MRVKKAKYDFTENDLPSNRKEVFFDTLKIQFRTLFSIGLIMLVFSLPLLLVELFKDTTIYNIESLYKAETYTEDEFNSYYQSTKIMFSAIAIVAWIIFGVGLSGALRIIRQLVWEEPVFFFQDFIDGIKKNGVHYAGTFFFVGSLYFVASFAEYFSNIPLIVRALPLGAYFVVALPVLLNSLFQIQVYSNKLFTFYKNSLILSLKTYPKTMLSLLVVLCPFLLEFLNMFMIKELIYIVLIVFLLPIILVGETLFYMWLFDKYININDYPEIYDKGVHRKEVINKEVK